MSSPPTVSIGVPVYNGEDFLEQALQSLLAQTYTDFELLVSDNASTDRTVEICERYVAQDPRVRLLKNDANLGAAANYNRLAEAATGKYFKWASHDDVLDPRFLERTVEVLDADRSIVVCWSRTMIIDGTGTHLGEYEDSLKLDDASPCRRFRSHVFDSPGECNAIFGLLRSDTLRQTPMIGPYQASDQILLGELALRGRFHKIPELLFLRRDHENTSLRAHATEEEHAVWFDPANKSKIYMVRWKWLIEYIRAIARVPLAFADKMRCYGMILKWSFVVRRRLKRELVAATRKRMSGHASAL